MLSDTLIQRNQKKALRTINRRERQNNRLERKNNRLEQQQNGETGGGLTSVGNWLGNISTGLTAAGSLFGFNADEDSAYNAEQSLSNTVSQLGPVGSIIGNGMKINAFANQLLGTNVNTYNENQREAAGISKAGQVANNVTAAITDTVLPGLGGLFKKTGDSEYSQTAMNLNSSYADSGDDLSTASTMSNKRYIFGRKKANNFIKNANEENRLITQIGLENTPRIQSAASTAQNYDTQQYNRINGRNLQGQAIGKNGMKLLSKEELARIYASKQKETVPTFGDGGKIGVDTNVIPEGALHAHKNNLEEVNPELDEVTEKGIPVIVTDKNGNYEQVAEIEKEELVFSKSVTEEIERLWKDGSEESMIKAGKLLSKEIIENTTDNTEEMLDGDNKN